MYFFVAKLLSISVMTYSNVYHLRSLRPMIGLIFLRTQRINFSMRPQHVGMARDPTVVWCLFSREPLWIPAQRLYCQRPESLISITAAIVWVYLYLLLRNLFSKAMKRWRFAPLTLCVYQFSRNYFSKVAQSEPTKPARKQNLTQNTRSRSFKFMHFGITEKPTTDCVSL